MKIKLFDQITLGVKTSFGEVRVTFTVVDKQPNYHYVLLAQNKICIGQEKANGTWILSEPIDLLELTPIEGIYHKRFDEESIEPLPDNELTEVDFWDDDESLKYE